MGGRGWNDALLFVPSTPLPTSAWIWPDLDWYWSALPRPIARDA
jgi:hypothetical protein